MKFISNKGQGSRTIALCLAMLSCASGESMAQSRIDKNLSLKAVGVATPLAEGETINGPMSADETMHVEVALRLRNQPDLDQFLASARLAKAERKIMPAEQLVSQHLPTLDRAGAVVAYLEEMGFRNVTIAPNRLLVSADGSAAVAQAAFHTTLVKATNADGETGYANVGEASVPASLSDVVQSVVGLQNIHHAHSMMHVGNSSFATLSSAGPISYAATTLGKFYGDSSEPTGRGISVGIISWGDLTQTIADLGHFTSIYSLAPVSTQVVNTNGTSTDISGMSEWNMDSQVIVAAAGGEIGKIIFYNIPGFSNANLLADINTIVAANQVKIINGSIGACERTFADGSAAAIDSVLAVAVAQGQTFAFATGDSGGLQCGGSAPGVAYPASSPYVVAVGGTSLGSLTVHGLQTAWSLGGGGISTFEQRPSWQAGVNSSAFRALPDVSYDADPYTGVDVVMTQNNFVTVFHNNGGTSLSAPIFAGVWARVLARDPTMDFAAGHFYRDLTEDDFVDITSGDNGVYSADVGYDLVTGFGPMVLERVDEGIISPPLIEGPSTLNGVVGTDFRAQFETDRGLATFSASGLPPGLAIQSDGLITGNPTRKGSYTVTLTATDKFGQVTHRTETATIVAGSPPVMTSASAVSGLVGEGFSFQITANEPATITTTTLPLGLILDKTGAIVGTPAEGTDGVDVITVTVGNDNGSTSTTLTISLSSNPSDPAF